MGLLPVPLCKARKADVDERLAKSGRQMVKVTILKSGKQSVSLGLRCDSKTYNMINLCVDIDANDS